MPGLQILYVVHSFPPPTLGGPALYARDLAGEFRQRGHTVIVLCPESDPSRPEGALSEDSADGLPIIRVKVRPADFISQLKNDQVARVIAEVAQALRANLVHIHHLEGLPPTVPGALAERGIPVIMTAHDGWLLCQQGQFFRPHGAFCEDGPETVDKCVHCFLGRSPDPNLSKQTPELFYALALHRQLLAGALGAIDTLIAPSRFMSDMLSRYGADPSRIRHLPLGTRPFSPLPRVARSGPLRFTYMGTIAPVKGLDLAIQALKLLPSESAQLDIWGRIVDPAFFAGVMGQVGPTDRVRYQGPYTPADLPRIVSETDVGVVPSRAENYPFVVREFFQGGVPVVAADVGGIAEIVQDGQDGLLFQTGDYTSLAQRMQFLMENPDQLTAFGSRVRPPKTISQDATDLEALYQDTLDRAAGRRHDQAAPVLTGAAR